MNLSKLRKVEKAITKLLKRNTKLIIQPDGLPNDKWSKDVAALRTLKGLSLRYH